MQGRKRLQKFERGRYRAAARTLSALMAGAALALPAVAQVDLVPVSLTRIEGGADSPPPTPVRVSILVRNDSTTDMPASLPAAGWTVQVQGYSSNPYVVRSELRAGEEFRFAVTVIVPCGKVTQIEVRVNASRSVGEANFDNNRALFPVDGNACPIPVRTGESSVRRSQGLRKWA